MRMSSAPSRSQSEGKARESLLKGRLSTVDLLVKIACFGKKKKNIA